MLKLPLRLAQCTLMLNVARIIYCIVSMSLGLHARMVRLDTQLGDTLRDSDRAIMSIIYFLCRNREILGGSISFIDNVRKRENTMFLCGSLDNSSGIGPMSSICQMLRSRAGRASLPVAMVTT